MKFLYADTQDYVDPDYDFINDRNAPGRKRYWDDQYAHEMMTPVPYDGLLVSMSAVRPANGVANSKVRYSTSEQQRFLREGARKFLRLDGIQFKDTMVLGDCGAFAYVEHPTPAYSPSEVVEFYSDAGFTHGCSPDHIIFNCDSSNPPALSQSEDVLFRYEITLKNAQEFLRLVREAEWPFEPLGAVQGWSPQSMANAAKKLEDMGYRYLAIGGLVPLKVDQIHEVLKELRAVLKPETNIHLLGFAKAENIHEFTGYGITSFDSTSPLIRAFKDAKCNYYMGNNTTKLDYYTAIRIPQAIENPRLMQGIKKGTLSAEELQIKEKAALLAIRNYDKNLLDFDSTLAVLVDYLRLTLSGTILSPIEMEKEIAKHVRLISPTLRDKPWQKCQCSICQSAGIETIIFRASNRNKRRGFHNLGVYHRHLQKNSGTFETMIYRFKGVRAQQASGHDVFSFAAAPNEILDFSEIERVGRDEEGHLKGFQRHQVASHIRDIRDYLQREDALLPNAIILAFLDGVTIKDLGEGIVEITIDATESKPGFVVDGQQRLSALAMMEKPGFQVFVSALICKDYNELRQQFVLVNNTRPLPKSLIYELLPTVDGLPERFTSRKFAARIIDLLNFLPNSSLFGEIKQHTNPRGVLSDMAMQKFVMNSANDGAIRSFMRFDDFEGRSIELINNFFHAVRVVFKSEWEGLAPRNSRLKHGAGLVSLSFVMELLYTDQGTTSKEGFIKGLKLLKPHTAWTSGVWHISETDRRPWNGIQNTPTDIGLLTKYLTDKLKQELKRR